MNEYEYKLKKLFKSLNSNLEKYTIEIKEFEEKIESLNKSIDALSSLIENEEFGIDVSKILHDKIKELNNDALSYRESIECRKNDIEKIIKNLQFLRDNVCPHDNTVFDYEDYHNGVDYYKCLLCGSIA